MKHKNKLLSCLLAMTVLLAACGGEKESNEQPKDTTPPTEQAGTPAPETKPDDSEVKPEVKKDPVSLNFFYNGFSESLTNEIKSKIETKFPHVSINMILHAAGNEISDVLASGTNVDLAAFTMGQLFKVKELELATDLTDLIAKHNFDTGSLSDGVLETVKGYSEDGKEIIVMPYELNNSVLLYNENIFDKFGVDHPVDGMTWDDVYEVIRRTSRVDDGVNYHGFAYAGANPVYKNQLGLTFVDPETNKATLNNDQWKRWLSVMTGFYQIENNAMVGTSADNLFFKDQVMALRTGPNPLDLIPGAMENGLKWDAVTMPVFPAEESSGSQMNAPFYLIPPLSKDKDAAFEVISFLMSEEIQTWNSQQGRLPIVNIPEVIAQYGANYPFLEGTNYKNAVFSEAIAAPIRVSRFDGIVRTQLSRTLADVGLNGTDLNTALREAEELANKAIEEAK